MSTSTPVLDRVAQDRIVLGLVSTPGYVVLVDRDLPHPPRGVVMYAGSVEEARGFARGFPTWNPSIYLRRDRRWVSIETDPPTCSACRRVHGREIEHSAE